MFLDLIYTSEFEEKKAVDIIYVMEISILLDIRDLVQYCFYKIQSLLNIDNFVPLYTAFVKSDVIIAIEYDESLLFDYFFFENQSKIEINDRNVKKYLRKITNPIMVYQETIPAKIKSILNEIYEKDETSDVEVISNQEKFIKLHKSVLMNFDYFKELFKINPDEKSIYLDYSISTLTNFFRYLYKQEYSFQRLDNKNNIEYFRAYVETICLMDEICFKDFSFIENFILSFKDFLQSSIQNLPKKECVKILKIYMNNDVEKIFTLTLKRRNNMENDYS